MNNEKREQQMMDAADRYAEEVCDESCTGAQVADTINDFCAGWRAADNSRWIPVEKELPKENQIVWIFTADGKAGIARYDKHGFNVSALLLQVNVTHWMQIVPPQGKEEKNDNHHQ